MRKPVFINIITVSNNISKTKHNYITTAIINMRTLAARSWCLEARRREERNGE